MLRKKSHAILFYALALSLCAARAEAQTDEHKFEVGAQFTVLRTEKLDGITPIVCVTTPCPAFGTLGSSGQTEPGVGGRFAYNLNRHVALEAELNLFPRDRAQEGGRKVEGLFGVKAGRRFDKTGLFAKARPGFLHSSKGDLRPRTDVACIASVTIFPPPIGCFEPFSRRDFAFDLGGVFEVYPTGRVLFRVDVGDTIVRAREHTAAVVVPPPPGSLAPTRIVALPVAAETTHNLQASVGVAFRF